MRKEISDICVSVCLCCSWTQRRFRHYRYIYFCPIQTKKNEDAGTIKAYGHQAASSIWFPRELNAMNKPNLNFSINCVSNFHLPLLFRIFSRENWLVCGMKQKPSHQPSADCVLCAYLLDSAMHIWRVRNAFCESNFSWRLIKAKQNKSIRFCWCATSTRVVLCMWIDRNYLNSSEWNSSPRLFIDSIDTTFSPMQIPDTRKSIQWIST